MAGGDTGTAQTIARIRQLVSNGKKSINVNRTAIGIVWGTSPFSQTEKAQAIFNWVAQNTRFISDIVNAETLRSADEILRVRGGDCDDLNAILIPSLLATIGIPSRLVTIAHNSDDPTDFSHIYSECLVDGQWRAMDVARPGAAFGRAPETYFRKRVWDLESPRYQDVAGMSGYLSQARPRRRGMGDIDDIVNSLVQDTPAITTGAANIIRAVNSPGVISMPVTAAPAGYAYNAAGRLVPAATATLSTSGISGTTLLLIGGALVAILLISRN